MKVEKAESLMPTLPADRAGLTRYRDPVGVVVHVVPDETHGICGRPGYYFLQDVTPVEAAKWR